MLRLWRSRRGQFVPITSMVVLTSIVLLLAVVSIYRVSKAKLQAQNLADAAALAVATLQAKCINTVVDRNEWLNHMYPDSNTWDQQRQKDPKIKRLPPISVAHLWRPSGGLAKVYARIVVTINKAQWMFIGAYAGFLGDPKAALPSMNAGPDSLKEILSEIAGLNDSGVEVFVYNTQTGRQQADDLSRQYLDPPPLTPTRPAPGANIHPVEMKTVPFEDVSVSLMVDGKLKTLTDLAGSPALPNQKKVGWLKPRWDIGVPVKTGGKGKGNQIGAGAIVLKRVPLGIFKQEITVRAESVAYVVKTSGRSLGDGGQKDNTPPRHFWPTYFVQLGVRS